MSYDLYDANGLYDPPETPRGQAMTIPEAPWCDHVLPEKYRPCDACKSIARKMLALPLPARLALASALLEGTGHIAIRRNKTGVLDRVRAVIPDREWTMAEIIERFNGEVPKKQVQNAIGNLARHGKIRRIAYGRYAALTASRAQEGEGDNG